VTTTDEWTTRLDVTEALEAAGWTGDERNPLDVLCKGAAVWGVTNDCGDSMLGADTWSVEFPSDVPAIVIVSACLAAAGQTVERLADVIPLRRIP
jgi:hypothetical protein